MKDREVSRFARATTAIVLAVGLTVAVSGCRESGANPAAEPVDQSQPAPARRGSYY
ncbi:MAG: hypothetical protein ACR2PO_03635 [Methyloligellaceae bacterium]